jgi:tetratricopeptide (TPR) repeat protein
MHCAVMKVAELLTHPLVLLLVGAAVTNYLIPRLTRRWQDRRSEIELKTAFVGDVCDSTLEMLTAVQFAELGAASQSAHDYDVAYRTWEAKRVRIGARIRGYFPDRSLYERWMAIADAVTAVYALSGTSDPGYRRQRIAEIRAALGEPPVDWDVLSSLAAKPGQTYRSAWFAVREAVLAELGDLVEAILQAPPVWLRPRPLLRPSGRRATKRTRPAVVAREPAAHVTEPAAHVDVFGARTPPDLDDLDGTDAASLARQSVRWFNDGDSERAIALMDRAVLLEPTHIRFQQRAQILGELGRHVEAVASARAACDLAADNDHCWLMLGEAHLEAGQPGPALEAIERALAIDPDYAAHWLVKAQALDGLGQEPQADVAYAKAGMTRAQVLADKNPL